MTDGERRKNTRVPLKIEAELRLSDGTVHKGVTENMSFGGTFLKWPGLAGISEGDPCVFALVLQPEPHPWVIEIESRVIHVQEDGVGLQFLSVDYEGYQNFRDLMVSATPDSGALMEELHKNPGLEVRR
ncbi:PilZ domain-containing protein [Dissulfurirhabdus thermomarina]|uniref:PilZ domain-containing protein n=1 Tax=Dissulfurirhabdus thermomarina TaxID=1765737 RepID=A0A6N9TRP6_DISTH|nr:PilZ domain-containing protein [Dissulfurirhabdus thermomarina]NDY43100.1 PilZ domain-containing protein [Dissulfurirhabdus thermomarina]NMX24364.1 PilZ domain-containing protein [Dissulfurirhabdus thermomarina]